MIMYAVLSHCTHHLLEAWDDAFDVMYCATPVVKNVNQCSPAHNCKTMPLTEL